LDRPPIQIPTTFIAFPRTFNVFAWMTKLES
jgi:hypothetical protein